GGGGPAQGVGRGPRGGGAPGAGEGGGAPPDPPRAVGAGSRGHRPTPAAGGHGQPHRVSGAGAWWSTGDRSGRRDRAGAGRVCPADCEPSPSERTCMLSRSFCRVLSHLTLGLTLVPAHALAASAGLPWEQPLQKLVDSMSGPVAKLVGVLAVTLFGLMLAFSDGAGLRWAMGILFGLAIAFAATSFVVSFFSFGGGAVW